MLPVIEITTKNEQSKKFMIRASVAKITHKVISDNQKLMSYQYKESYISNKDILKIEWEELFLSDTTNQFTRIEEFLKLTGSVEEFRSLVSKYVTLNNSLINEN
jgi:ribonucleotide reductase beta subunit family protein with ferritin-like domain